MILMIDNYDSFTYNLVQYVGELGEELRVVRNDKITLEEIERLAPDYLMISPGPCTPNEAGISMEAIRYFAGKIPMLGVCLGHQSIGQVFGGKVVRAERLMHGKTSEVYHDGQTIFRGIPSPFTAARYHSLILEEASLPDVLEVTARTEEGEIMAVRHRHYPIEGVQFHPESIITQYGKQLLQNFLDTYAKQAAG
ncbi:MULTISPECIES: aminodeoxychorismate/anthranilate synthase component II [Bacillales]|jgi:para-aminobenzoate synthetase component II|uniref:Aminodeoxychorismate/anthranilate synthase component II n=1 Tax=Brevibacillus aydinogluensis TaxID=927786 RepID=A0AA48RDZ0_9BACL|nr:MULTISPECIES: aminodeoxychorismate/anthranilate synthase component II [Bacillales]REK67460.1 MAG: aminodeoxychorismate/anthranilate synthase component II [Brevibacillus sp.]MBR8659820.1 aminodeoxychorismate/anthranilate synthase component II [Brevibacillus sp. NL20B1]MDT3418095.1 anthranilate synthase/aminodeoxychorismate synthase-like glutamine amidotransferase [Brevibacillus aydinogluensis]NNV04572.1 aminodeoxychorismate/anthranilate synthase component II [Brevibacillus sp. MCWH]UFJ62362.